MKNAVMTTEAAELNVDTKQSSVTKLEVNEKHMYKKDPYCNAGIFSRLFFCWVCRAIKVKLIHN